MGFLENNVVVDTVMTPHENDDGLMTKVGKYIRDGVVLTGNAVIKTAAGGPVEAYRSSVELNKKLQGGEPAASEGTTTGDGSGFEITPHGAERTDDGGSPADGIPAPVETAPPAPTGVDPSTGAAGPSTVLLPRMKRFPKVTEQTIRTGKAALYGDDITSGRLSPGEYEKLAKRINSFNESIYKDRPDLKPAPLSLKMNETTAEQLNAAIRQVQADCGFKPENPSGRGKLDGALGPETMRAMKKRVEAVAPTEAVATGPANGGFVNRGRSSEPVYDDVAASGEGPTETEPSVDPSDSADSDSSGQAAKANPVSSNLTPPTSLAEAQLRKTEADEALAAAGKISHDARENYQASRELLRTAELAAAEHLATNLAASDSYNPAGDSTAVELEKKVDEATAIAADAKKGALAAKAEQKQMNAAASYYNEQLNRFEALATLDDVDKG